MHWTNPKVFLEAPKIVFPVITVLFSSTIYKPFKNQVTRRKFKKAKNHYRDITVSSCVLLRGTNTFPIELPAPGSLIFQKLAYFIAPYQIYVDDSPVKLFG